MSQQLKVAFVFCLIVAAALILTDLNDALIPLSALIILIGVVVLIVWVRRRYQRERPKPPWPPSAQDPPP